MKYQKTERHGLTQRPNIIFHIPTEHSRAGDEQTSMQSAALKHRASVSDAKDDFNKLNQEIFRQLDYPLGFFLNIAEQIRSHARPLHGELSEPY